MYQKNELKNLIYIQENKSCDEQTIKGLFRSIVEPILEKNTECLVLIRLEDKSKQVFSGILKRLEYSSSKVYDFSDKAVAEKFENVLKEKIWNKTEFVYVLSERFGASFIFDYEEAGVENFAQYYLLHNSKNLSDSFGAINSNSKIDLSEYETKWRPDRRDNDLLNLSIRKIVENLNETNQEIMLSKYESKSEEDSEDLQSRLEFMQTKSSQISHEMRNLMSICNLYSTIIEKQWVNVSFATETSKNSVANARGCIAKSMRMMNNLLLEFKSLRSTDLKEHNLNEIILSSIELSKVYANDKKISIKNKNKQNDVNILVDEDKFLAVLINLIKNAVESIKAKGEIIIDSKIEDENVKISVSNNGSPIPKDLRDKIFQGGFTTKPTGSGLGLVICKKTLEEQFSQLKLLKSDDDSTEFEITVLKGD